MESLTPAQIQRLAHLRSIGHHAAAAELERAYERQRAKRQRVRRTRLRYFGLAGRKQ